MLLDAGDILSNPVACSGAAYFPDLVLPTGHTISLHLEDDDERQLTSSVTAAGDGISNNLMPRGAKAKCTWTYGTSAFTLGHDAEEDLPCLPALDASPSLVQGYGHICACGLLSQI